MHLVAALRKFHAERRGQDSAAAYRGVAGDADFERGGIGHGVLEPARGVTEHGEGVNDERIGGPERDGLSDAGTQAGEARAGELEFDVVARGGLGGVGLHGGVIGVLVFVDGGGEDETRADAANDRGEGERVRERRYEVGVAA